MTEHFSLEQIERLRKRLMSTEEIVSADEHLSQCEQCRNELEEPNKFESSISYWQSVLKFANSEKDHPCNEQNEDVDSD